MKRAFRKPAITCAERVVLLQVRGMVIDDRERVAFYLQYLKYYRLGAYWLRFEADQGAHRFLPGTRFDTALALYVFDRELCLLVLDAVERIESRYAANGDPLPYLHGPTPPSTPGLLFQRSHLESNLAKQV